MVIPIAMLTLKNTSKEYKTFLTNHATEKLNSFFSLKKITKSLSRINQKVCSQNSRKKIMVVPGS